MRRVATIWAVLLLTSCGSPTAPADRAPGAVPFEPPPRYESRYAEMEACAETEGDFSRVNWYMVPEVGDWSSTANGDQVVGEWWPPHDIYIAEYRIDHGSEQKIIDHEILHELLQSRGHPVPPFGGVCAPTSL